MRYDRTVYLDTDFATAVSRVREALAEQGFGILTEIDVTATLKAKLDHYMEDYVILAPATCRSPTAPWRWTAPSACCCPATSSSAATATTPPYTPSTPARWSRSPNSTPCALSPKRPPVASTPPSPPSPRPARASDATDSAQRRPDVPTESVTPVMGPGETQFAP